MCHGDLSWSINTLFIFLCLRPGLALRILVPNDNLNNGALILIILLKMFRLWRGTQLKQKNLRCQSEDKKLTLKICKNKSKGTIKCIIALVVLHVQPAKKKYTLPHN